MIVEVVVALALSILIMVIIGTIVRQLLALSSTVNYVAQQLTLGGVAYYALGIGWGLPAVIIIAVTPIAIHAIARGTELRVKRKAKRGEYGQEAMWAYELYEAGDTEFIRAQNQLSKMDVQEVQILADSKDELREMMIERYEDRLQNS